MFFGMRSVHCAWERDRSVGQVLLM